MSLYDIPDFSFRTGIRFERQGLDAKIVDFEEYTSQDVGTSKTSTSLNRQFNPNSRYNQSNSESIPFAPGGLTLPATTGAVTEAYLHRDNDGLYDIPPGFSRGLRSEGETLSTEESASLKKQEIAGEIEINDLADELERADLESSPEIDDELTSEPDKNSDVFDIDTLIPQSVSFGRTEARDGAVIKQVKQYAHVVDVNKSIENFDELVPTPAKVFPFELDTFQKEAVLHLEQGDSVFIAAHTSAGKTVVAEYAIAMAQRNLTKCIYTSPIKALSNQKYRDFKSVYEDVGILTGDVQINPEASCLIMTTEILRSMLYRGADLIRDVEFVIFDEVHYVNDQDRGVVWEEAIIMLPEHVKFVLLSATVPNTMEFAEWVGRTKKKDIYVISTSKRPVPLEHYLWSKDNLFKIVDADGNFITKNWNSCEDALSNKKKKIEAGHGGRDDSNSSRGGTRGGRGGARGAARGAPRGGGNRGGFVPSRGGHNSGGSSIVSNRFGPTQAGREAPGKTSLTQLCQYLAKHKQLPAVFFVFSQKRCQEYALMLSALDYCSAKEKSEIRMFIDKAITRLKKEDRELPQILMIRDILSRGIGIHHGGLLPIVKELIEILFAKSLVKILFATETIAMGLNLPTKTVIYTGTWKSDGNKFRLLYPGEYTQMSGRAGRRGLDPTGTVIIMVNGPEPPSISSLKNMVLGAPTKLHSQFRLTYSMILNLLRVEALKVEEMIKRSFSEHSAQTLLPEHEESVKINEDLLKKLKRTKCAVCDQDIEATHEKIVQVIELNRILLKELPKTLNLRRKVLAPGRLVVYYMGPQNDRVGLGYIYRSPVNEKYSVVPLGSLNCGKLNKISQGILLALYELPEFKDKHLSKVNLSAVGKKPYITGVDVDNIIAVGNETFDVGEGATKEGSGKDSTGNEAFIKSLTKKKTGSIVFPPIGSIDRWPNINNAAKERAKLLEEIAQSKCITCDNFPLIFEQVHEQFLLKEKIQALKNLLSNQNLELLPDYNQRIAILKDLNYIDDGMNVLLKGRVACEISIGFELIITELLLDNFLGSYEPEEIVALMSVFVFEGTKSDTAKTITQRLDVGKEKITEIVKKTNEIFEKHQIQLTQDESEFLEKNRFALMEATYEWAKGMSFYDITQLTDVPEGKIVRVITRLDEVFRQVMVAANLMGDDKLYEKMAIAKERIKRDIVFCASLYL